MENFTDFYGNYYRDRYCYVYSGRKNGHFHEWCFPTQIWMFDVLRQLGEPTDEIKVQHIRPLMEYAKEKMRSAENLQKIEETQRKLTDYINSLPYL